MQKYIDYWEAKGAALKGDIAHINEHLKHANANDQGALRTQKAAITDELMVCLEAIERLKAKAKV